MNRQPARTSPAMVTHGWNQRWCLILVLAATLVIAVAVVAGPLFPQASAVICVDGACSLFWVVSATALGAAVLGLARVDAPPLLRCVTSSGIGLGLYSLLGLGLGTAGWLNHTVVVALPIVSIVLFAGIMLRRTPNRKIEIDRPAVGAWLREPAGARWFWVIPVFALGLVLVSASELPGILWKPDPHPYDTMSYHLQVPREWFEMGRIVPLRHNMFSFFPFNVEMQFLLLMHLMGGPWLAMYACQFMSTLYAVLMVLTVAASASSDSENRRHGLLGAAAVCTVPWVLMLGGVGYVESALMFYTALAVTWTLRATVNMDAAAPENQSGAKTLTSLLIAGAMTGFAAGVKITAVPMLMASLPLAVLILTATAHKPDRSWRRTFTNCIGMTMLGLLVLSPWLIRNAIATGNPLWPIGMKFLGAGHFTPAQVERFRLAHSPTSVQQSVTARLGILLYDVLLHWQYGFLLLPLGVLAMFWQREKSRMIVLGTAALTVLVVWFGFTHLLARFLVMLIPISGIAIAGWATPRWRWQRLTQTAVVTLAALVGFSLFASKLSFELQLRPLIGLVDLSKFLPDEYQPNGPRPMSIGIVGDAQAFLYQVPTDRLHYRTVFDLPADDPDPLTAWVGYRSSDAGPMLYIINTAEIERVHDTYYRTPPLPKAWAGHDPPTFNELVGK